MGGCTNPGVHEVIPTVLPPNRSVHLIRVQRKFLVAPSQRGRTAKVLLPGSWRRREICEPSLFGHSSAIRKQLLSGGEFRVGRVERRTSPVASRMPLPSRCSGRADRNRLPPAAGALRATPRARASRIQHDERNAGAWVLGGAARATRSACNIGAPICYRMAFRYKLPRCCHYGGGNVREFGALGPVQNPW